MKDKNLHVRMSESDYETIRQKAYGSYRTISDYITMCGLGKEIYVIKGLDELIKQQKYIGNNLNQLTRLANAGKIKVTALEGLKAQYESINKALNELLLRRRWR